MSQEASNLDHEIVFFEVSASLKMQGGSDFLKTCPVQVRAKMFQILLAVANAPPKRFSGGGYWEAMRGDLRGVYEVRADFKNVHYRLFCLLDYEAIGKKWPLLVVLTGMKKSRGTVSVRRIT